MESIATYHPSVYNTSKRQYMKIINDRDVHIYMIVNYYILSTGISMCGMVGNVINIIVFYKQGFDYTMNISLCGMAISDLCSQVAGVWTSIVLSGFLDSLGFSMNKNEVMYLSAGHIRVCFARITSWITVFITAERCLCITFPLKIKQIITPGRTKVILCVICVVMVLSIQPEYIAAYLDWKFDVNRNKTILGMVFTSNKGSVEGLAYIIYAILGLASFILVIVFTLLLVFKLKQKKKWRQEATNDMSRSESASKRDHRTISMVVMIATVLIICFTPIVMVSLATLVVPEFRINGQYSNAFFALGSFVFVFESFNSSVNIFLYFHMSSKYRETFNRVFFVGKMSSANM